MYTNNYHTFRLSHEYNLKIFDTTPKKTIDNETAGFFNSNGSLVNICNTTTGTTINPAYLNTGNQINLFIGSGSTPATPNDYKLEAVLTNNLTHVNTSFLRTFVSGKPKIEISRTFTYSGAETIFVREAGLIWVNSGAFLLAREVLTTPLEVHSGETFTVNMGME